jgi:apolipoprotein N-acyltransferase
MIAAPLLHAALSLLCGAVFAFAFPPTSQLALGFAALVGFMACAQRARSSKSAFWIGYAFGAGQFLINFSWIANAFSVREGFSYSQGLAAVIALALAVALYPGFATLAAYRAARAVSSFRYFTATFALIWFLAEWLRGFLFTGFPWNPVGAIWGSYLPVAQVASVVGVYGLSAITLVSAGMLAAAFAPSSARQRALSAMIGAGVMSCCALFGHWVMPSGPAQSFAGLELVLVQANIPQEEKWARPLLSQHLQSHIRLSNDAEPPAARGAGAKRLLIWPETAYPYLIEDYPASQRDLQRALGADATLIFGANRFVGDGASRTARNAMFLLQEGALKARYDKVHLVPFGEYVPLAPLLSRLGVQALVDALSSFSKGEGVHVMSAAGVPAFAPMICYEGIFSRHLFGLETRPKWILNISNDAWFGQSSGPSQHLNLVRFRAIEQGLSVVRSTGTGISAVIDPYGRLSAQLPAFAPGALVTTLPQARETQPVFARLRGWFIMVFAVAGGILLCLWRWIAKI